MVPKTTVESQGEKISVSYEYFSLDSLLNFAVANTTDKLLKINCHTMQTIWVSDFFMGEIGSREVRWYLEEFSKIANLGPVDYIYWCELLKFAWRAINVGLRNDT